MNDLMINKLYDLGQKEPPEDEPGKKRPYQSPRLLDLGTLRGKTLGGSAGAGESSNPGTRFPGGPYPAPGFPPPP